MANLKFFVLLFFLGATLFFFSFSIHASSWVGCNIEALVIKKPENGALVIRILKVVDQQSGFGRCPLEKKEESLTVNPSSIPQSIKIKAGDKINLEYVEGSSMTPNGAFSYERWEIIGVKK